MESAIVDPITTANILDGDSNSSENTSGWSINIDLHTYGPNLSLLMFR